MADLYPTPTRVAVLHAVAAGRIVCRAGGVLIDTTSAVPRRVTSIVEDMRRAEWVTVAGTVPLLTDAGHQILAEAGPE